MPLIVKDTAAIELDALLGSSEDAERSLTHDAFPSPGMRDIELRAGVFSADELLAERLALTAQLAPLDAVVGPAGIGEAQLKSLRYGIAAEARQAAADAGVKITEAAIEEKALSDPRYRTKLDEMEKLRVEYVIVKGLVDRLTAKLQWAQSLLRYAANEPRT